MNKYIVCFLFQPKKVLMEKIHVIVVFKLGQADGFLWNISNTLNTFFLFLNYWRHWHFLNHKRDMYENSSMCNPQWCPLQQIFQLKNQGLVGGSRNTLFMYLCLSISLVLCVLSGLWVVLWNWFLFLYKFYGRMQNENCFI